MENPSLYTIYGDSIFLDRIIAESPQHAIDLYTQGGLPEGYENITAVQM